MPFGDHLPFIVIFTTFSGNHSLFAGKNLLQRRLYFLIAEGGGVHTREEGGRGMDTWREGVFIPVRREDAAWTLGGRGCSYL